MTNIHHAEMTYLVRREKELERKLEQLRDDFGTWKERVELAKKAGRDELVNKARERIDDLRFEAKQIRSELKEIVEQKKELRMESRRPTGEETRRAEALLKSFKESGLVDPDEAQLEQDIKEAAKHDDAELDALKVKAGLKEEPAEEPKQPQQPEPESDPEADLDAELEALRQKMGDAPNDDEDIDLDELEAMLGEEE